MPSFLQKLVAYLVLLAALLLAVGCVDPPLDFSTRPTIQDETLVTGRPCLPPCWHGIIPGETNTQDALNLVKQLPFVDSATVEETVKDLYLNTDNSILWLYPGTSDFGGRLFFNRNRVSWLRVSYPVYLRLEEIIARTGEPDWVWAGKAGSAGTEYIFRFFFETSGLMLESRLYGAGTAIDGKTLLSSDIEIEQARYFQPQSLRDYFTDILGAKETESKQISEAYLPWPGFGVNIELRELY